MRGFSDSPIQYLNLQLDVHCSWALVAFVASAAAKICIIDVLFRSFANTIQWYLDKQYSGCSIKHDPLGSSKFLSSQRIWAVWGFVHHESREFFPLTRSYCTQCLIYTRFLFLHPNPPSKTWIIQISSLPKQQHTYIAILSNSNLSVTLWKTIPSKELWLLPVLTLAWITR